MKLKSIVFAILNIFKGVFKRPVNNLEKAEFVQIQENKLIKFYLDTQKVVRDSFSNDTQHRVFFHSIWLGKILSNSHAGSVLLVKKLADEERAAKETTAANSKKYKESERYKTLRYTLFDENRKKNGGKIICAYCGKVCNRIHEHKDQATIDHIVPLSENGDPFDRSNLVVACRSCNREKRSKPQAVFLNKRKKTI